MTEIVDKAKGIAKKLTSTGFGHLFGSSVINKILGFMSSVILVRIISKADYGVYSNADNILGLFCIAEGFGMASTFLQHGSTSTGENKDKIWSFCFYFSLLFQIVVCTIVFISSFKIKYTIPGTEYLLRLMAFLPVPRSIRDLQQVYLRTEFRNKEFAFSNTLSTVVTVLLSCMLSILFQAKGMIIAGYISAIVSIVYIAFWCRVPVPKLKNRPDRQKKINLLNFSFVCVINNSSSSIMYLIDTFILGITIASSTVTASYKVASKIPTALFFIPACVMTYIYPYFARNKDDGKWCFRNYKKVVRLFGSFNLLLAGTLIVFAPFIVQIVFGKQYLDSVIPFRLLCLNYIIQASLGTVSGQLLVSQEKLGFNTIAGIASSVMNTALNIWLIPRYSSVGAAIATVTVSTIISLSQATYFYLLLKKKAAR